MEKLIHRTPSVGHVVNQLLAINPELGTQDIAGIIRACMGTQGGENSEFMKAETIDLKKAIEIAKKTLQ